MHDQNGFLVPGDAQLFWHVVPYLSGKTLVVSGTEMFLYIDSKTVP